MSRVPCHASRGLQCWTWQLAGGRRVTVTRLSTGQMWGAMTAASLVSTVSTVPLSCRHIHTSTCLQWPWYYPTSDIAIVTVLSLICSCYLELWSRHGPLTTTTCLGLHLGGCWMHLFIIIFAKTTHCVLMLVVTKGFMSPPRVIMSALKCIWNSIVQK